MLKLKNVAPEAAPLKEMAEGFLALFEQHFPMFQSSNVVYFHLKQDSDLPSRFYIACEHLPIDFIGIWAYAVRKMSLVLMVESLNDNRFICTPSYRYVHPSGGSNGTNLAMIGEDSFFMIYDASQAEPFQAVIKQDFIAEIMHKTKYFFDFYLRFSSESSSEIPVYPEIDYTQSLNAHDNEKILIYLKDADSFIKSHFNVLKETVIHMHPKKVASDVKDAIELFEYKSSYCS